VTDTLLETPLAALHRELGGRMVPFAGYTMPVQYTPGIMAEHLHCRAAAALFDVSHMGQAELVGEGAAAALERLTPADAQGLKPGRQRYGLLLNETGGIVDDFMVANLGDRLFLVVNASRKHIDLPLIEAALPAGLGARDSLRLEAGLCLYGNDIDETTSPVEANLVWSMGKRRRMAWDFPGAARIRDELDNGAQRLRVGIRAHGRQPARQHTEIHAGGAAVGEVTSGGFGPSVNGPVAMGYVARGHAADGTPLELMVRGKALPAAVAPLPFHPHRYAR